MNEIFLMCYIADNTLTETKVLNYLSGYPATVTRKQAELVSMVDRMWKLSFTATTLAEFISTINILLHTEGICIPSENDTIDTVTFACNCAVSCKGVIGLLVANKILHGAQVGELTLDPSDVGVLRSLNDVEKWSFYFSRVKYGKFSSGS